MIKTFRGTDKRPIGILIKEKIHKGLITESIRDLRNIASEYPYEGFAERLNSVEQDFAMMREYMLHGMKDPHREELFHGIQRTLLDIQYDLSVRKNIMDTPLLQPYKRTLINRDLSVEALRVQLLNAADEQSHYEALTRAFFALIASYHWKKNDVKDWVEFLTSPHVRETDSATLISALTLSVLENHSAVKTQCLAEVYVRSTSELVRQRAFVGCILAEGRYNSGNPHRKKMSEVALMACNPDFAQAVKEIHVQMLSCANAVNDSKKVRESIMPNIIKNQPFIITPEGIKERPTGKGADGKDAAYDPNADEREEKGMEEMEHSVQKMVSMQQKGADVFFEGFSQMKRYPFFYKAVNWFLPFYKEHPDIQSSIGSVKNSQFIDRVTGRGPFCESDKYSFVIAMGDVIKRVPENIRKMMEDGEVGPIGMFPDSEAGPSPSFLRLQYLQDLYRFYSLSSMSRGLYNPFSELDRCNAWLCSLDHISDADKKEMCLFLLKKKPETTGKQVITTILNRFEDKESYDYLFSYAEYAMFTKHYNAAIERYNKCMALKPDNIPTLRSLARAYYITGDYDKAASAFDALHTLQPQSLSHQLNYAMAMTKAGKGEDVVNLLYKLEYENPDNVTVNNTLGWTLMYVHKPEQALTTLQKAISDKAGQTSRVLNLAYAYLINNNIAEGAKLLHSIPKETRLDSINEDAELLSMYGIGPAEIAILASEA